MPDYIYMKECVMNHNCAKENDKRYLHFNKKLYYKYLNINL